MAMQFIYQPHVRAEGMVITPDLPLARVLVALGDAAPVAVPARRLVTDQQVQVARAAVTLHPALALVAASEGTLAVPACVLTDPDLLATGDAGRAAVDVVLSRQAWRLDAMGGLEALTVAMEGGETLPCIALADMLAACRTGDGKLPYGMALIGASARNMAAGDGGRRVLTLQGSGESLKLALDLVVLD
ncbi:MAG: hypothetical protein JJU42_01530 [Rhodobacteraceae bacterium]|nr:hypothetical protein [Paracoccaceae bacterium]